MHDTSGAKSPETTSSEGGADSIEEPQKAMEKKRKIRKIKTRGKTFRDKFATFRASDRQIMMDNILSAIRHSGELPPFTAHLQAINCHHNYVAKERHYGEDVYLTRKGAVRAGRGELGIIPGSMGTRSFIVRGLGNPESFESCSHGAGRAMSRGEAKRRFTVQDQLG